MSYTNAILSPRKHTWRQPYCLSIWLKDWAADLCLRIWENISSWHQTGQLRTQHKTESICVNTYCGGLCFLPQPLSTRPWARYWALNCSWCVFHQHVAVCKWLQLWMDRWLSALQHFLCCGGNVCKCRRRWLVNVEHRSAFTFWCPTRWTSVTLFEAQTEHVCRGGFNINTAKRTAYYSLTGTWMVTSIHHRDEKPWNPPQSSSNSKGSRCKWKVWFN